MSVTTTSGCSRSASASRPGRSPAVPASSRSSVAATSREMPSRSSTWSSASTTRILVIAADRTRQMPCRAAWRPGPHPWRPGRAEPERLAHPAKVVPPPLPGAARAGHNDGMRIAWYASRASWRQTWRVALLVAIIGGLLGSVAPRRARRSAQDRLRLRPPPPAPRTPATSWWTSRVAAQRRSAGRQLPGAISTAAWLGLNANPVMHGQVIDRFRTDGLAVMGPAVRPAGQGGRAGPELC